MRVALRILLGGVVLWLAMGSAQAQNDRVRYKWRDETGSLHFADMIPPEATKFGYEVVNKQGITIRRVERAKTPEELAAAKAAAEKTAAERKKLDDAARTDAQMLAAYPTEDDLRKSIQAQIDLINQNIQATQIGIASQEKSLAERLNHADEQERVGKPVPPAVQKQINTLKEGLSEQRAFLQRRTSDRDAMAKQMETSLEHYRQIKQKQDDLRKGR
ncbi:MAG TPA: DUF4124 domain-containing protein [Tahibacter sp.]|nr:DUF4124 domain-containing protein [Tahibacter sp.]